jgi:hypothetical protein
LVAGLDEQVKLGNPQITLRSLVLWIGEPLKRLKWIYSIIYVHKEKNDASIFHTLDQFSKYGDPQISTLVNTILVKSAQPIIDMIMTYVIDFESLFL